FAAKKALLLGDGQDELEDLLVDLEGEPLSNHRERGVVGHLLGDREPEELAKREAVRAAPRDSALRVDPFEVADQKHSEVDAGRDRGAPDRVRVEARAERLDRLVEAGVVKQSVHRTIERVPCRSRKIRRGDPQLLVCATSLAQCHPSLPRKVSSLRRYTSSAVPYERIS